MLYTSWYTSFPRTKRHSAKQKNDDQNNIKWKKVKKRNNSIPVKCNRVSWFMYLLSFEKWFYFLNILLQNSVILKYYALAHAFPFPSHCRKWLDGECCKVLNYDKQLDISLKPSPMILFFCWRICLRELLIQKSNLWKVSNFSLLFQTC